MKTKRMTLTILLDGGNYHVPVHPGTTVAKLISELNAMAQSSAEPTPLLLSNGTSLILFPDAIRRARFIVRNPRR